jgi:hypothetical protein
VGADGTVLSTDGFATITRVGVGLYTLTLTNPLPDKEVATVLTPRTTLPAVGVALTSGGVIAVTTFDAAGFATDTPADQSFHIVVTHPRFSFGP